MPDAEREPESDEHCRMKICLIGPIHPLRGGIAQYNMQLARELGQRHETTIVSFSRQYPALLFPGRTQLDPSAQASGPRGEPLLDSIDPLSWLRAGRRIAALEPDLVVVHWWHPFFAPCIGTTVRSMRRHRRAPVAFICHNVLPHEPFPGARNLTRFALAPGDAWLLHSTSDRRALESLGLEAATLLVTPHPRARGFGASWRKDEARCRLALSGHTLLFFGLIRPYKGLADLLEALRVVLRQLDCTLLVVGEFYHGKAQALALIRRLGIEHKVRVIDRFIPDDEVGLYFSAADLVVLPYRSATQSGIVPIAFAFERPVIATRVGGLSEAVRDGETGLLVEPNSPAALAEAIVRFYEDGLEPRFRRNIQQEPCVSWAELAAMLEALANSQWPR